jgi:hypothetical protein
MKKTAAAFIAALALAAPAGAAAGESARFDQSFELQPNTTAIYRMNISELHKQCNSLEPGWGLEVQGSGVDLAVGNFGAFWGRRPAPQPGEDLPEGGLPDHQPQPDGSLVQPMPEATPFTPEHVRLGMSLRQVDWNWKRLDRWGNPKPTAGTARSAKAAKRLRARRLRAARKKIVGKAAQSGPVTVVVAGFEYYYSGPSHEGWADKLDMLAKVTTGALTGPTTLTLHARVAIQPGTPSPATDGCRDGS